MPKFSELTLGNGKFHFKLTYSAEEPNRPIQVYIIVKTAEHEAATVLELAEAIYKCFRADDDSFEVEGQTVLCEIDLGYDDTSELELPTFNMDVNEFVSHVAAQIAL